MLRERSNKKELLDQDGIANHELAQNLKELHVINKWLGGYSISTRALYKCLKANQTATVVDIGCGGGDTVKTLHRRLSSAFPEVTFSGIDIKPFCIAYSNASNPAALKFICDDYRNAISHFEKVNVLHASLFCHHLTENEIIDLIRFCYDNKIHLVINDLERNVIAWAAISLLTRLFSSSRLVKNDAPLSVKRGFKRSEWIRILERSGATNFNVSNRWAFRHEIIVYNE